MINVLDIDPAYLQTMGIQLVGGRNFERGSALDSNAYIVNEALIRKLNWDDAVGKMIMRNGKHPIIGVTSDFNFASLHKEISPLILTMVPWQGFSFLSIRYEAEDFSGLISQMGETWSSLEKTEPFDFFHLEEYLGQAYTGEENFGKMVGYFGIIAIIIACLGLLGLSSYMTEQRRKEVGIRKVLGASAGRILTGYAAGFLKLVLVANILAIPLVWALMNRWLENFAYRAGLPWSAFLIAFLLSVGISLVTISIQVWRASRANPVEALRAE
jgi:putative ABC transport system permease protein